MVYIERVRRVRSTRSASPNEPPSDEQKHPQGHSDPTSLNTHTTHKTQSITDLGDVSTIDVVDLEDAVRRKQASVHRQHIQRRVENAAHYGIERLRMYPWKWVEFVVNVVWVFVLWFIFSAKVPTDGPWLYFHYFTNWMWTTNVLYYTVDLLTYLDYSGTLQFYWLYVAWWPFFGNVCQVFWLVIPLLWLNPRIVVETAEQIGWSATLVGERIVHVLPLVRAWFYLWCRSRDIIDILRHYWWENPRDRNFFALYMMFMWLGGNLLIAAYCLNYDFHRVYGLDLNYGVAFVMIQVIFVLFLILPVLLMSPAGAVMRLYGFRHADEMPLELHELQMARTPPTVSDMARRAKGGSGSVAVKNLQLPPNVVFRRLPQERMPSTVMKCHWLLKRAFSWM